ncbi:MAG: diacylglycerol kinase family protein, partial [Thermoleophilaceae bacterium]
MGVIALLANPESGSGEADRAERLLRNHGADVSRFALDETTDVAASHPERIVVAGGDGSIGCAAEVAA